MRPKIKQVIQLQQTYGRINIWDKVYFQYEYNELIVIGNILVVVNFGIIVYVVHFHHGGVVISVLAVHVIVPQRFFDIRSFNSEISSTSLREMTHEIDLQKLDRMFIIYYSVF